MSAQSASIMELKNKLKSATDQSETHQKKIKMLEATISKHTTEVIVTFEPSIHIYIQRFHIMFQIKQSDSAKQSLEQQMKTDKDKIRKLEADIQKHKTEQQRLENEIVDANNALRTRSRSFDKTKIDLESEITALKARNAAGDIGPTKKLKEVRRELDDVQSELDRDRKRYAELTGKYEHLEEDYLLAKAQLTAEKENLQTSLNIQRNQLSDSEDAMRLMKKENFELSRKLSDTAARLTDSETKTLRQTSLEYEKNRLKMTLTERDQQIAQLKDENEMNRDVCDQLRREIDELKRMLTDFERVNKAQSSLNDHTSGLEQEVRRLKQK